MLLEQTMESFTPEPSSLMTIVPLFVKLPDTVRIPVAAPVEAPDGEMVAPAAPTKFPLTVLLMVDRVAPLAMVKGSPLKILMTAPDIKYRLPLKPPFQKSN